MRRKGRPRTDNPKVCKYYRIDFDMVDAISIAAKRLGISRSELVRRAIREFIGGLKKKGIDISY